MIFIENSLIIDKILRKCCIFYFLCYNLAYINVEVNVTVTKNNQARLCGRITSISKLPFLDDVLLGNYFIGVMEIKRPSGKSDLANILFTFSDLKSHPMLLNEGFFEISGSFRSHRIHIDKKYREFYALYPTKIIERKKSDNELDFVEDNSSNNLINLVGKIKRIEKIKSIRSKCCLIRYMLAVKENSPNYMSFIPCLAWDDMADLMSLFDEGAEVNIEGNLNSSMTKKTSSSKNKLKNNQQNFNNSIITRKVNITLDNGEIESIEL